MLKINLRKKIIFLFLFFGLLPLLITFILTATRIQWGLRGIVNNNLILLANEVKNSVEKTSQKIYTDIELLATNPLIRSEKADNEEKLAEIKRIQDFYGIFEDITLLDLEGKVIVSTTYKYHGDWEKKQWYQNAKKGKTAISPVQIILGPYYRVILSSTAPVKDEQGKVIAVVAGQVNMEKIWKLTDELKIGSKGFVFIVDKDGRFIAHPKKEKILDLVPYPNFIKEIFSKESGIVNYTNENKERMIGAFVSFSDQKLREELGWKILVTQPETEAFALVKEFQREILIIFLIGFLLILFISYWLGSQIVNPLKKLIFATKKIAAGQFESKIEIKTGDEIETLGKSFNQMAEDLKKYHTALEESKQVLEIKVKARTKELEELTQSLEEKVKERTEELQKRISELEKFQRLTIGRELRILELKEEIKKLKKELEKYKGV